METMLMSFDSQLSSAIVNTIAVLVNTFHLLWHSIWTDLPPSSIDLQAKHYTNFNMATKYASGCQFLFAFCTGK